METNLEKKIDKFFVCKNCNYKTSKLADYNKHLLTSKHKKNSYGNTLETKNRQKVANNEIIDISNQISCNNCQRIFMTRSGLWKHKTKCKELDNKIVSQENNISSDLIVKILNENRDMKQMLMDQQKQIIEILPLVGNNSHNNSHNTINNKFNINVFLNEKCKDALNMSEFIKTIQVSLEQLDFTKQKGLADGLSKTIMDNINKLSVYERPMHCTDVKRETLYIKEDDTWTKDKSKEKIKNAIKKTSNKNYQALQDWKLTNPDFMENDDKKDYFVKTISTIGKPTTNIDEKIIKTLCKETYVKDEVE